MTKIWYQLDDDAASELAMPDDANVNDFAKAVIAHHDLDCKPGKLQVLRAVNLNMNDLQAVDRMALVDYGSSFLIKTPSYKSRKATFNMEDMVTTPLDVYLPFKATKPAFVSHDGYLTETKAELLKRLDQTDHYDSDLLVPPMAMVRISRGGKTRTLKEIAHMMRGCSLSGCIQKSYRFLSFSL